MSFTMNAANFLMLSVFAIAAFGYILGRITIKGISLGTAGVFVIALIYGGFFGVRFNSKFVIEEANYASQALKIVENLGLVFFVTSVGFIAGPNFFKNMKKNFKSYVLLGFVIILSGGLAVLIEFLINLTFRLHETFFWSLYPLAAGVILGGMLLAVAGCKPLRQSLHRKFFI